MDVRGALDEVREVIMLYPNNICPQHIGLTYRLCDFVPDCTCETCWFNVVDLYLRGEIQFGEIDEGH